MIPTPPDPQDWQWQWQLRHAARDLATLKQWFPTVDWPAGSTAAAGHFPLAVTPYYASLVGRPDFADPVFAQFVPRGDELHNPDWLNNDPLTEEQHMPVPGLIHRYPDRALVLASSACAVYCRHCMRKRVAGAGDSAARPLQHLPQWVAYLQKHPAVKDVLISGGDPLMLETNLLEKIIAPIRQVPSVEIIRIASRTPATLPMRIDKELVTMLRRYAPLFVSTHFNHPAELSPLANDALNALADGGIPVANQTVLLRGVNDSAEIIEALCRGLLRSRARPYYLFQCDLVEGTEHFRTPLSRGLEIMAALRGRLSGLGIPHFAVDTAEGGKIELLPESIVSRSHDHTILRSSTGQLVRYPEPQN